MKDLKQNAKYAILTFGISFGQAPLTNMQNNAWEASMQYIEFDAKRPLDLIPMGRIAIDFNPVDYFKTLVESDTFKKYVGGSPANIAVGLARLGKKVGFIGKVSDDRFGDYVTQFFQN